jgi:hypothetical protein
MAGTSHFADAMRHPRTQVALAQFAISPSRWLTGLIYRLPIVTTRKIYNFHCAATHPLRISTNIKQIPIVLA